MLLHEAEHRYKIKFPESFRKTYDSGILYWLNCEEKRFSRLGYELERKKDVVFCGFYMRFILFADIENALAVFNESFENDRGYAYGKTKLNTRYTYIPFAKVGWNSRDYYILIYDNENPSANARIGVYHTKAAVMYICAVDFEDLMFQHLVWKIKSDRKSGICPEVVKAYAMFLDGKRADMAQSGEYDALIKEYEDFLLTENGIILDRQKFFPLFTAVDKDCEKSREKPQDFSQNFSEKVKAPIPDKLIINGRFQKISIDFDDIRYIEADNKISCIRLKRESVHCGKSFSFIESLLPEESFFRCHKSFIIGFKHIITHCDYSVIFDNGEKAVISKRKYNEFKERYGEYLRKESY
ncbi:MAG: LytTR family transcriptional regulator [Oscillospiraceae bacterium]|nr:LytTR family transcriptional regulator [Oscillospiraceae bacterium]